MRRILLELWAMFVLASVIGFLGPFGTWPRHGVADRIGHWWLLLMGAYLLIRPAMLALRAVARATDLPMRPVVLSGVALLSIPLAVTWRSVGQNEFRELGGYVGVLPFALLCALAVMGVALWAEHADRRLRPAPDEAGGEEPDAGPELPTGEPALRARLSPGFRGPILALQSEDHYVRVHGEAGSELLLMRLRDAIAEMDGVAGEQVHRSWWVAREAVTGSEPSGRSWTLLLSNGQAAPVARDSIARLQEKGFLPATA